MTNTADALIYRLFFRIFGQRTTGGKVRVGKISINNKRMDATTIRQGISYVTNSKGEKTALQLDLTNAAVQEIVEDLMDTLDSIERRNEPTRSFIDVKNEILASRGV